MHANKLCFTEYFPTITLLLAWKQC